MTADGDHHYFLDLAYDGTAYRGYQRQPGDLPTVQQALEDTLSEVLGRPTVISGCGRTDAGVHASQYFAGLRLPAPPPADLLGRLRYRLPGDIAVRGLHPVAANANARFDATERTYDYFLHTIPDPLLGRYSTFAPPTAIAPALVAEILPQLVRHGDFRPFCKTPDRHPTTRVDLRRAEFYRSPAGDRFRLRFVADRFLRGMIRLLVHYALNYRSGKPEPTELFAAGQRPEPFRLAPPEGLFLTGVRYPYLDQSLLLPAHAQINWVRVEI